MRRRVKPGRLLLRWTKHTGQESAGPDFVVDYPGGRWDSHFMFSVFTSEFGGWNAMKEGHSLVDELEKRGYDPTTLRFQIDKKEVSDG